MAGEKKPPEGGLVYRTALLVKNTIALFYYQKIYNCGASLEILDQVETGMYVCEDWSDQIIQIEQKITTDSNV